MSNISEILARNGLTDIKLNALPLRVGPYANDGINRRVLETVARLLESPQEPVSGPPCWVDLGGLANEKRLRLNIDDARAILAEVLR